MYKFRERNKSVLPNSDVSLVIHCPGHQSIAGKAVTPSAAPHICSVQSMPLGFPRWVQECFPTGLLVPLAGCTRMRTARLPAGSCYGRQHWHRPVIYLHTAKPVMDRPCPTHVSYFKLEMLFKEPAAPVHSLPVPCCPLPRSW